MRIKNQLTKSSDYLEVGMSAYTTGRSEIRIRKPKSTTIQVERNRLEPCGNHQLKQLISVQYGTWNRKLKSRTESDQWDRTRLAESGTDVDSGNWNWNWTLTGTGLVSRIDVIGLFVDPEQELMFQSRIDVIGLLVDPGPRQLGWTPTAWLDLRQLGWNLERNW